MVIMIRETTTTKATPSASMIFIIFETIIHPHILNLNPAQSLKEFSF